jgi:hypothetical protein
MKSRRAASRSEAAIATAARTAPPPSRTGNVTERSSTSTSAPSGPVQTVNMHRAVAQRIGGQVERGVPERAGPAQIACLLDLPVEPAIGPGEARIGRGGRTGSNPSGPRSSPAMTWSSCTPSSAVARRSTCAPNSCDSPSAASPKREQDRDGARQREAQAQAHAASRK